MDFDTVRTFVVAADLGQFQAAADELSISQQAASKRIIALERELDVRLFNRTPRGAQITIDGQALLPHAREFLRVHERAVDSVHPGRRALRVDVLNRRIAPAVLIQDFYRANPGIDLDVVTLSTSNAVAAIAAVRSGEIDATIRAVMKTSGEVPDGIRITGLLEDPLQVLVGPSHPFAGSPSVTPTQLADHRIWIPGIVPGTEWSEYYEQLSSTFGLTIDAIGPNFGTEALLDAIAESTELATLVGQGDRYLWPAGYDLRRIPLRNPTPVYPHSLIWREDNAHPVLGILLAYLESQHEARRTIDSWMPTPAVSH